MTARGRLQRHGRAALGALAAGALVPAGFAPLALWPLSMLCLAALLLLTEARSPRAAALLAYLFGLAMFGAGVGWIHESFQYNNVHGPVVYVLSAGFVAFLALFPAGWAWAVRRLGAGASCWQRLLLLAPAAWMLVEWLRGWLFTGFTWLQLGYAHTDSPAAGLAALVGSYGIGWLAALTAGALALALLLPWRQRWRVLAVLVAGWLALLPLGNLTWTRPLAPPLPVALVQGNYAQDIKWRPENRAATLRRYRDLTEANADARLVVWPETAIPALAQHVPDYLQALGESARRRGATVLVGAPYRDDGADRRLYNSMLAVGAIEGEYHKRHLVPFGEYLPLRPLLAPVLAALAIPAPSFSSWRAPQPAMGSGTLRLGLSICYEAAFGSEIIDALPGATVLVNVSNDAWFGDTLAPHQHLQIARMRAMETGRYLLRATNTGISAIIGPRGAVLARSPQFRVHVLRGVVQPLGGLTPYARTADWPAVASAALVMLLVALSRWRSRRAGGGQSAQAACQGPPP